MRTPDALCFDCSQIYFLLLGVFLEGGDVGGLKSCDLASSVI